MVLKAVAGTLQLIFNLGESGRIGVERENN